MNLTHRAPLWAGLAALAVVPATHAQLLNPAWPAPSLDRWMYPFNFSAGAESSAPTFGAISQPGFDDRDAQFIIGFSTASQVVPGQPLDHYRLRHVHRVPGGRSSLRRVIDRQHRPAPLRPLRGLHRRQVPDPEPGRLQVSAARD